MSNSNTVTEDDIIEIGLDKSEVFAAFRDLFDNNDLRKKTTTRSNLIENENLNDFRKLITYLIKTIVKLREQCNEQKRNDSLYESTSEILLDSITEQAGESLAEIVKNNMIKISEINNKVDTLIEESNKLIKRIEKIESDLLWKELVSFQDFHVIVATLMLTTEIPTMTIKS